jgi:ribosomal-protein-alanine N-acetyltransferase
MTVTTLFGRRVLLRPLEPGDFAKWQEVRRRNRDWLTKWEPQRLPGQPDVVEDARAFSTRCSARQRERQLGTGFGFGVFVEGVFAGEVNLNSIQRGPFQNAYIGYWIDEAQAGNGYVPEAFVVVLRFCFEELRLHRVQAAIVPRNSASLRVAEKLGLRDEGTAQNYLEINGAWEDHVRFGITAEDWAERGEKLTADWIGF